jgi:hypothetical protein
LEILVMMENIEIVCLFLQVTQVMRSIPLT